MEQANILDKKQTGKQIPKHESEGKEMGERIEKKKKRINNSHEV